MAPWSLCIAISTALCILLIGTVIFLIITIRTQRTSKEELLHSHALLRYIIEHSRNATAILDNNFKYVYVSQRYIEDYRVKEQDLIGRYHYDVFPDLPERFKNAHRRALEGEVSGAEDDPYIRADGTVDWTTWECRPWYEVDGKIGGIILYTEVTTARKRIEESLRSSERLLRNIIDSSPDYIVVKDHQLRTVLCNRQFASAVEKAPAALVGKTDIENGWTPEFVKGNPEKGIRGYEQDDQKALGGQSVHIIGETAIIGGSKRVFDTIKQPLYEDSGEIIGLLVISRDVTEQKRSDDALRESENRYRNLVMFSPDAIFVNVNDRLTLVNMACVKLFHARSEDDLIGKSPYDLFSPEFHEKVKERIYQLRIKGKPVPVITEKIRCLDGNTIDVDVVAAPFQFGESNAIHVILRDITERKNTEEKMKASLKEKEMLLQEIYHRTKNNMQVISSLLDLQASASGNDEIERIVSESTTRIRTMSLAHEKLYKSSSLSHINMKEYITDLAYLLVSCNCASDKPVNLDFDLENIESLIDIAIPCGLIINELFSNALKHAFPNGHDCRICISLHRKEANTLELCIKDNGVGLPEGFDILTTSTLGVQLVLQIVYHQLRGSVRVESKQGLTWYITLREEIYKERI